MTGPREWTGADEEGSGAGRGGGTRKGAKGARAVLVTLGAALLGLAIFWTAHRTGRGAGAASPAAPAQARAVSVTLAVVESQDVPIYLEGLGSAVPLSTVSVKSQVDGLLERVFFEEGQMVKKGQLIAQIDPRPFTIQLHQAEATLARDNAQLRNAGLNLERYRSLRAQNLIPEQQLTDQQAAFDQLSGVVKADEAQVEGARLSLDYARIDSPTTGITGVRLVDPGNLVHTSDATGIVIITQLDPMGVLFTLPQDDLGRVSDALSRGEVPVEAYSRDGAVRLGEGRLALVDNQVNANTATIRLKAIVPNPSRALWPNQFVKARALVEMRKGATTAPAAAVQRGPAGNFVYVVDATNHAAVRPVQVDAVLGPTALFARGLSPGEKVVVEGANQLRPGATVAPRPPATRAAAPPADSTPHGGGPPPGSSGAPGTRPRGP